MFVKKNEQLGEKYGCKRGINQIYYLLNPEFDSMHKMSILFSHIETLIKYDQSERENKK